VEETDAVMNEIKTYFGKEPELVWKPEPGILG
jgi:hypothetical protein